MSKCEDILRLYSQIDQHAGIKYRSCSHIENLRIFFEPLYAVTGKKHMKFCCEPIANPPRVEFCGTAEEMVKNFIRLRAEIIAESIKFSLMSEQAVDEDRRFTSRCAECHRFQLNNWRDGVTKGRIYLRG